MAILGGRARFRASVAVDTVALIVRRGSMKKEGRGGVCSTHIVDKYE